MITVNPHIIYGHTFGYVKLAAVPVRPVACRLGCVSLCGLTKYAMLTSLAKVT